MKEYLVSGHLGGLYTSTDSPEYIMQICETCGDCDWIVAEWEEGNIEEEIDALHDYLVSECLMIETSPIVFVQEEIEDIKTSDELEADFTERINELIHDIKETDFLPCDEKAVEPIIEKLRKLPNEMTEYAKDNGILPYDEEKFTHAVEEHGIENYYGSYMFQKELEDMVKILLDNKYVETEDDFFIAPYREVIIKTIDNKKPGFAEEYDKFFSDKK